MKIFKHLHKILLISFCSIMAINISTQITFAAESEDDCKDWIKLNTDVPFIGKCIHTNEKTSKDAVTPVNAFPKLMWALMNLLMTVILIMSLLMIVYSWVLMTTGWYSTNNYTKGLWMLSQVAKWMALLWASWVILKVINPNFFV